MYSSKRFFGIARLLVLSLAAHFCLGQGTLPDTLSAKPFRRDASIGLDVFKNIPPLLLGKRYYLQEAFIVEAITRHRTHRGHYAQFLVGYTQGAILERLNHIARQELHGWYLKGGTEWDITGQRGYGYFGVAGVVASVTNRGTYHFPGRTFGDYVADYDERNNLGFGAELSLTRNFYLSDRWLLRWVFRGTLVFRMAGDVQPYYYPGVGYAPNQYNSILSGGSTLQLHYRLR
ncbi:hypothetical protein GCM10027275_29790 [Rhabdobacter roseus]|uniref:DUF3575 domain-containing protein n=1 Tax=Rhabdobacter roseus TaxID=1655419 RepID=A0A840TNJ6_9BACT|nr:hypothetical protein [Rhabdobacter roseus]MBB5284934.1 hypothetical protein [Rhabdobacter roseus]